MMIYCPPLCINIHFLLTLYLYSLNAIRFVYIYSHVIQSTKTVTFGSPLAESNPPETRTNSGQNWQSSIKIELGKEREEKRREKFVIGSKTYLYDMHFLDLQVQALNRNTKNKIGHGTRNDMAS